MKTKNRLWSLYLALLNVNYGWSAGKFYYIKKRQRIWEPIVIVVSIAPLLFLGCGLSGRSRKSCFCRSNLWPAASATG